MQIIHIYNKLPGDAHSDVTALGNTENWFRTRCVNKGWEMRQAVDALQMIADSMSAKLKHC